MSYVILINDLELTKSADTVHIRCKPFFLYNIMYFAFITANFSAYIIMTSRGVVYRKDTSMSRVCLPQAKVIVEV